MYLYCMKEKIVKLLISIGKRAWIVALVSILFVLTGLQWIPKEADAASKDCIATATASQTIHPLYDKAGTTPHYTTAKKDKCTDVNIKFTAFEQDTKIQFCWTNSKGQPQCDNPNMFIKPDDDWK